MLGAHLPKETPLGELDKEERMKRRARTLSLHRETLRNLQTVGLGKVVGGTADTTQNCEAASYCACPGTLPDTACYATCSCSWQGSPWGC